MKEKKSEHASKMKQCLRCGEKIYGTTLLHPPCAKMVFGVNYLPVVDLEPDEIPVPQPLENGRQSISFVQPEIHLTFNRYFKEMEKKGRKPGYIFKPAVEGIPRVPELQNLALGIAARLGIAVPRHSLIRLKDGSTTGLILKRFDRIKGEKIRTKTFTRLLNKEHIHDGSLEDIGAKIWKISQIPGLDVQLFFEMILLSFLIGHSDLHFDKFSILYDEKRNVRLAPMKDLVSTKLLFPNEDDFALPMLGKTDNITGDDLAAFARHLDIPQKAYDKMVLRFFDGKRSIGRLIKHSILDMNDKIKFEDIVNDRFKRLLT